MGSIKCLKAITTCVYCHNYCLMHRLTPVASGGSPLDPAALDPARSSFVQIHGVLHYRWKLRLDLRCTDALLEEPWSHHTHRKHIIQPQSLISNNIRETCM